MAREPDNAPSLGHKPVPEQAGGGNTARRSPRALALDRHAADILAAVLAEVEALKDLGRALEEGTSRRLAELRDLGIPYRPDDWFGGPLSWACRKAYSRAAVRLEAAGLIVRITQPKRDRVTHLQLTAAGLRRALRLVRRRADPTAVAEGLGRTTWGKQLAAGLTAGRCSPSRDPSTG